MKGGYDRVKMSGKIVKGNHDAVVKGNQAAVQRRQRGAQKAEFDYEKYKNDPRILDRFAAWYVRSAREGSLPIKMFFDNVAFFNKGGVGDEGKGKRWRGREEVLGGVYKICVVFFFFKQKTEYEIA